MTQRAFAAKVDMEYGYVNKFFTGRKPNIEFIEKVISIFPEVDLNWLLRNDQGESMQLLMEPEENYGAKISPFIKDIEVALKKIKTVLSQP